MQTLSVRRNISSASVLEQSLLGAVVVVAIAMLSLPAARGVDATLGWVPFWLLALPLSAWCALRLSRRWSMDAVTEARAMRNARRRQPRSSLRFRGAVRAVRIARAA